VKGPTRTGSTTTPAVPPQVERIHVLTDVLVQEIGQLSHFGPPPDPVAADMGVAIDAIRRWSHAATEAWIVGTGAGR
jgi:hypothetical protein